MSKSEWKKQKNKEGKSQKPEIIREEEIKKNKIKGSIQ